MERTGQDGNTQRSFSEQATTHSHSSEGAIPVQCFKKFIDTLDDKFSEMIDLHREMIRNVLNRQERRGQAINSIVDSSIAYATANTQLQCENEELERLRRSTYGRWH